MSDPADKDTCHMVCKYTEWIETASAYATCYTCTACNESHLFFGISKPQSCPCCGRKVK